MADETRTIRIVVDASRAVDGSAAATRAIDRLEKSQNSVASSVERLERAFVSLGAVIGGAIGTRAILDAADAFTRYENALRVAGVTSGNMAEVSNRLFGAANRNGVEIGALSTLFSRASMAATELGASQEKLLKFVDGVTAGLRLQGGSTESASGALLQLSQALGSGIVRAEEFNSILEGAFPIAQAAARGIDGMGGSVAKLRTAVANGEVTSAKFFEGLLKGFTQTEREAAGMSLTVGQAVTVLNNGFTRLVGEIDKSTGVTAGLASAIAGAGLAMDKLAKNLGNVAEAAAVAGTALAVAFAPKVLGAMAYSFGVLGAAGVAAMRAITAAMLANPLGALAVAIVAAGAAVYAFRDDINQALGVDVVEIAKRSANYFIGSFVAAYEDIKFVWNNFGDMLGAAVIGGVNIAIDAINDLIKSATKGIDGIIDLVNNIPGVNVGKIGQVTPLKRLDNPYVDRLSAAVDQRNAAVNSALNRDYIGAFGNLFRSADGGTGGGSPGGAPAAPMSKEAESIAERMRKALQDSQREFDQAKAFAEVADQGAAALERLEVHFKALKTAQEVFGKTADQNAGAVQALTKKLEEQALATERLKSLTQFMAGTLELEKSNELLEAENRLINASTETRARELALIRLRHEVESKGLDASNEKQREAIERRASAIEQNERLKAQGEELRKAQELWTAPLKKALESIQQTAADAFDKMLESGKFSFASLGDVFKTTIRRMIAEFLALATVRPVMSVVVQALGGAGLVSPGTASALGYGTSGGQVGGFGGSLGGFGGGGLGGGGLGAIFGGGSSGGGWMGSVGEWLNTPFTGPYAGMSPSSMAGVPTLSPSLMSPSTWSITPMQGLGAAAGIGMGAYTLATGKGGTGSTISGIGQMIGGAVSLIPGFGQIAGPIIGLASSIIGGLIGDGGYKLPPISSGNQRYTPTADFKGSFNNYTWAGGQELGGKYAYTWNTISELLQRTGGKLDPSKAWSGEIYENQRDGTSYTYLLDPNMNSTGIGGGSGNQSWTLDAMVAQVFSKNVKYAMTGISETLRKAVNNREPGTEVEVRQLLELVEAYDTFGKVVPTAKKALEELNDKFDALASTARLYSLDLAPIDAERKKMTERYANDFIDGMLNPLQVQLRALEDERKQSLANAEYIRDNVEGVYVDIEKITSYWNQRKLDLEAQYYEQSYGQIETLIRRLTYGDLANASATLSLSGARATYEATLAQARAGSQTAISGLAGDAEAYANTARSYYGSTVTYDQLIAELRQQLEEFTAAATGSTTAVAANDSASVAAQNNAELRNMVRTLADTVQRQSGEIAELTAVLKRQRG